MVIESIKLRMLNEAFNLAGMFIAGQLTKPDYAAQEKLLTEHYAEIKDVARKQQAEIKKEDKQMERHFPVPLEPVVMPSSLPEVEKGTACLPCVQHHFSTVSGALNEAIRFGRKEGITHPEVIRRLGIALDELNIGERIDLASDEIVQLKGREKELAEWGLNASRDLRHEITAIRSPDDLEQVAAHASNIRKKYMRSFWDIASADGTIEKLCKGLKEEEKERCIATINSVLKEKKEKPP